MDNTANDLSLNGTEYSECSTEHRLDVITEAPDNDPVLGVDSSVTTNVTIIPCELDLRRGRPTHVVVTQAEWNEFENVGSGPDHSFDCWETFTLDTSSLNPQTTFATVQLTTSVPSLMVAEQFVTDSTTTPVTASAARNVHFVSGSTAPSTIKLAPE